MVSGNVLKRKVLGEGGIYCEHKEIVRALRVM